MGSAEGAAAGFLGLVDGDIAVDVLQHQLQQLLPPAALHRQAVVIVIVIVVDLVVQTAPVPLGALPLRPGDLLNLDGFATWPWSRWSRRRRMVAPRPLTAPTHRPGSR